MANPIKPAAQPIARTTTDTGAAPQAKPVAAAKPAAQAAPVAASAPEVAVPDTKITTTVGAPAKGMKPNVNPNDVKKIQTALIFIGCPDITVSGTMDAATIAGIKKLQQFGMDMYKQDKTQGLNPALFAGGKPDGVIQPGKATNKFLTEVVQYDAAHANDPADGADAPAAPQAGATGSAPVATAPKAAAAPAQADYVHGLGHTIENERSGEALYQGLGIGNRDNGSKNLGIVSGAEQMFAGKTENHGTIANIAIGTGAVISGTVRTVASAPYVALDNLDRALSTLSSGDSGALGWLIKGVQWLFVKPFKFVAELVSFLGGLVSALFLWDNGGKDLVNRLSESGRDLEFVENDAARDHRLEREQISRDVDESTRSDAASKAADLKKFTDDKAKQDASVTSLSTSIASLTATMNAAKDQPTKDALASAIKDLTKELDAAKKASKDDQAKIDAASKATIDNRYAKVNDTIEEINGLIKADEKAVASEKVTDLDSRKKIQVEIDDLKVILASQSKVLAGLTPPTKTAPTAPASGSATAAPATGAGSTTGPQAKPVSAPAANVIEVPEQVITN